MGGFALDCDLSHQEKPADPLQYAGVFFTDSDLKGKVVAAAKRGEI